MPIEELSFTLGCLIFPKIMLKMQTSDEKSIRVITVYYYLYKFSLDRMQKLLNDLPMMLLFCKYLELSQIEPSSRSTVNRLAYLEASLLMLKHSKHLAKVSKAFKLEQLYG